MASIKQLTDCKYKITVSNGYRKGKKICKAKNHSSPSVCPLAEHSAICDAQGRGIGAPLEIRFHRR